jgi:tRNA modification GTPase
VTPSAPTTEGDLIAALATGAGPAAIAVLRLSGAGALEAARTFLVGLPESPAPRKLLRALAVSAGREPLDDVLAVVFPAPNSYTGEGVVEVHCHGGLAVAEAVQAAALEAGARFARPGEFTQRAVSNGKMDLLEAEALAAVLEADGSEELRLAQASRQLVPRLRELALRTRSALAGARGDLDYPIELAEQASPWRSEAASVARVLGGLLTAPGLERTFREGAVIALLGPPNAGKSSLFNALMAERRALVDAEPGTTRDAQPGALFLAGRRLPVVDTAGIRDASGIEAKAVERSFEVSREAQAVVWVEDVSAPPMDPPLPVDLWVLAKADLAPHPARGPQPGVASRFSVSALSGQGLGELREALSSRTPLAGPLLSARQQRLAGAAVDALAHMPETLDDEAAEHLATAERALSELIGEGGGLIATSEIYARFCVGK